MTKERLRALIGTIVMSNNSADVLADAIYSELNPPATPKLRTADGVEVKDGDTVWMVFPPNKPYSARIVYGKAKFKIPELGIECDDNVCYTQTKDWPIFSSYPAACKYIATLLGVKPPEIKPLPPMDLEDEVEPAESEPLVNVFEAYEYFYAKGGWASVAKKWTEMGILQWTGKDYFKDQFGLIYDLEGLSDVASIIRSQIAARGKADVTKTLSSVADETANEDPQPVIPEKTGEDEEKWVGYDMRKEADFIWGGVHGWTTRLDEVVPFTSKRAAEKEIFETYHVIPLSAARKIEEDRLRKEGEK